MSNRYTTFAALSLVFTMVVSSAPYAQEEAAKPSLLPGGATSLTETHDHWTVSCRIVTREDQNASHCSLSQQQATRQGQRALAIELSPSENGVTGTIVLPFGLAVTEGVTLRVDENEPLDQRPFSTCLPGGCLVPVEFDAAVVEALSQGTTLGVSAIAVDGGEANLAVSLAGFTSALNRTRELTQ